MFIRLILNCILLLISLRIYAIDFSSINTFYWYDPNVGLDIEHRVVQNESSLIVFIELKNLPKTGSFRYLLQADYNSDLDTEITSYKIDTLWSANDRVLYQLSFLATDNNVLVVHYSNESSDFYYPINLTRGKRTFPSYYPVDQSGLPILSSFVTSDKIQIKTINSDTLYFFQYAELFPPADPPSGTTKEVAPSLGIDSIFAGASTFSVLSNNFYFIQQDTFSTDGLTIYCGEQYYPAFRRIEELILPLRYITRTSELNKIAGDINPKRKFDDFWLQSFSNKELARSAIRGYYRKVTQANQLFTDYKQGWKTDRGLIFIMFGIPREVYRKSKKEIWVYEDTSFEFRIISNLFAPSLYILMRDKTYEDLWFNRVKVMRGGS